MHRVTVQVLLVYAGLALTAASAAASGSRADFGANRYLSEGAMAIQLGQYERGISLTEKGLADKPAPRDRAAALSNLCAAHVGLERHAEALRLCNASLELDDRNWRTWNNRAAAMLGLGLVQRAIDTAERGLTLNPRAEPLQQTLEIARERLEQRERDRERGRPVRIDQVALLQPELPR